jgi:rod shape-determining protein MreC
MKFLKINKKVKIVLIVIGTIIFLNIIGFSSWGQRILFPLFDSSSSFFRTKSGDLLERGKSRSDLLEEISDLRSEIQKKEVDSAKIFDLEEENKKLREFLNFKKENSFKHVLANVIWQEYLFNLNHYNQDIVINKGRKDGLREGLAVVNESGVVIGKIVELSEKTSKVCLISNNFCKMAVSLNNGSRSLGLSEGDLGLSIKVNFVSQNEDIQIGDRLVTSGLEPYIPKGLALGRVIDIEHDVSDIWQDISAEPFFDSRDLNVVSVIVPE